MSGLIWIQSDTQMVFLKEFSKKDDFEKNQQTTKKHKKFPRGGGMGGGGKELKKVCQSQAIRASPRQNLSSGFPTQ